MTQPAEPAHSAEPAFPAPPREPWMVPVRGAARSLSVDLAGPPDGTPVFLLHGTPGSRLGPRPRSTLLHRQKVRLISYDRPGYGWSDRQNGRTVADAAQDIACIADALGLDTFAVLGRSGGGPHALAAAALLPERVTQAVVLVSLAPADADDLEWFEGMNDGNRAEYTTALDVEALEAELTHSALLLRKKPDDFIDHLLDQVDTPRDQAVLRNAAFRKLLRETYSEAVRQQAAGWIDDVLAFRRPWNFDVGAIRCPVKLWHGGEDEFSPVQHSGWLQRILPGADLEIEEGAGHFSAMEELPALLKWVTAGYRQARDRVRTDRAHLAAKAKAQPVTQPVTQPKVSENNASMAPQLRLSAGSR